MKRYNCIFLDRDGTLNPDPGGYISSLNDFSFYDFTIDALKKIAAIGNQFCIITNQSGISRGLIKQERLDEIHSFIKKEFNKNQIPLLDIYVCPDHPDNATEMRKPGSGMFLKAELDYGLHLSDCLMIGDSLADIKAGEMLGMDTMLVLTGRGETTLKELSDFIKPTYVVKNLSGALDKIS